MKNIAHGTTTNFANVQRNSLLSYLLATFIPFILVALSPPALEKRLNRCIALALYLLNKKLHFLYKYTFNCLI